MKRKKNKYCIFLGPSYLLFGSLLDTDRFFIWTKSFYLWNKTLSTQIFLKIVTLQFLDLVQFLCINIFDASFALLKSISKPIL